MNCTHKHDDGSDAWQGDCTGVVCTICGAKQTRADYLKNTAHAYSPAQADAAKPVDSTQETKTAHRASAGRKEKVLK